MDKIKPRRKQRGYIYSSGNPKPVDGCADKAWMTVYPEFTKEEPHRSADSTPEKTVKLKCKK